MTPSKMLRGACGLFLLALAASPAHAQIESGHVIDDSTGASLVGSRVVLQHDTAGTWKTIQTTHTDERGLFQFAAYPPGIYRVALLGSSEPRYFGVPDTLAADSMQEREFALPVVRRGVANAYLASDVEQRAQAIRTHYRLHHQVAPRSPRARSARRSSSMRTAPSTSRASAQPAERPRI